jgi:hypothetical protein
MSIKKRWFLLSLLAPLVALADGPFGVTMGDDPTKFPACKPETSSESFECSGLPKAHPDFDYFLLMSTKETGVCKIAAMSPTIDDNGNGTETRRKFEQIKEQLIASYGQPTGTDDFITPGALWKEPGEWLMAVYKKERTHAAYWLKEDGFTGKNDVTGIRITVQALSRDEGVISLGFEFTNVDRCLEIRKKQRENVF